MSDKPSVQMRRRTNIFILAVMMIIVIALIAKLFKLSILDNKFYQEMANADHFGAISISADRGAIYDANGVILAQSATVYKIFMDPDLFRSEIASLDEEVKKQQQNIAKGELSSGTIMETADHLKSDVIQFLAEQLGIEPEKIEEEMNKDSQYRVLKTQVEKPIADNIIAFMDEKDMNSIQIEEDTKRYYPQNELAASVIGFTNADGDGQYGLEYQYDDYLSGIDGKVISAKDANGNEMPYRYSKNYEAQDGNSLYLTIDRTLQYSLEKNLEEMVSQFDIEDRGCGIIMNAKTGAVLAMATAPGFDLNNPSTVDNLQIAQMAQDMNLLDIGKNEVIRKSDADSLVSSMNEDRYTKAYVAAREQQWKNKAITDLYIPGSVFKVVTSSAALEEKAITIDDIFECTGSVVPYQGEKPIHCWNTNGHGTQTFVEAITHSCNPAFIEIGKRLGAEKFFDYFQAYGLTEKTGIDLPAESSSIYQALDGMGPVELASCSFGQTNKVTPMEMITAYAAVINGGNLVTPYVVSKIVDNEGNVVLTKEKTVKRQVISEETSKLMCETLEQVAIGNGAYIKGYHVGGKSGTSEKLDEYKGTKDDPMRYVASYCCFAPADDPEIILLIMADEPMSGDYYGSQIAVPYSRKVMEEILPYLGYYPEYTDEEAEHMDVDVPFVEDKTLEKAIQEIEDLGLTYQTVGDGETVYGQMPLSGSVVAQGGTIILYTSEDFTQEEAMVPDMTGYNLESANDVLVSSGLNLIAVGASTDSTDAVVQSQSVAPGSIVVKGTVIELTFGVNDQSG
ncbi:MAG: penicillin-binding transpeptidase domain-containing protein [Clostridium sp.]|nr:penicillin-binding transpeptidase domain-containing protein [Clostridium sp.]MCM1546913.1 penicillin-binding transpeptidase domain-containing protein [Ruminococcus sp.]